MNGDNENIQKQSLKNFLKKKIERVKVNGTKYQVCVLFSSICYQGRVNPLEKNGKQCAQGSSSSSAHN